MPGMNARRYRRRGRAAVLVALLAAVAAFGWAIAAVVGLATSDTGLVVFGVPCAAYFGFLAWLGSARSARSAMPRQRPDLQDRFFERLGIEWFLDPDRPWKDRRPGPLDGS